MEKPRMMRGFFVWFYINFQLVGVLLRVSRTEESEPGRTVRDEGSQERKESRLDQNRRR